MNIDENNISNKSQIVTLILCLLLGQIGAHRFYVGKYFTGVLFLIVGGTSLILDILGVGYAFVASIIYLIIMILDVYALYSDSFTDKLGRLVIGSSKALVYENLVERENIIFEEKLNKIVCILVGIIGYVVYFLLRRYLF